jgi:hypothetical protein
MQTVLPLDHPVVILDRRLPLKVTSDDSGAEDNNVTPGERKRPIPEKWKQNKRKDKRNTFEAYLL